MGHGGAHSLEMARSRASLIFTSLTLSFRASTRNSVLSRNPADGRAEDGSQQSGHTE